MCHKSLSYYSDFCQIWAPFTQFSCLKLFLLCGPSGVVWLKWFIYQHGIVLHLPLEFVVQACFSVKQ